MSRRFLVALLNAGSSVSSKGQQGKKKNGERNDRVIAIEEANHSYAHIQHVNELGKKFLRELEEFFVNYHDLDGEKYRVLCAPQETLAKSIASRHHKHGHLDFWARIAQESRPRQVVRLD
jgi:Inorganic pyrophosphatase